MVKEKSFITIQAFMVNELQLKGNELLIYAIIHGFSQDGQSEFTGSLQYLADWTNSTKQGVIKALKSLMEKQLILKNETFQNNLKFCTYKVSQYETKFNGVLNKVERGYETKFNGGMKQSLPNNINNNITDNLEDNIEVPAPSYIPKTEYKNCKEALKEIHSLILSHNKEQKENKKKISICNDFFNFSQNEARVFIELFKRSEPGEVLEALKNYLRVASSPTYISSFSIKAFSNRYNDYLPDFFDMSKYVDAPKSEEDIQAITQKFADDNMYAEWFDYAVFHHNRKKWIQAGQPKGEEFTKWADICFNEDVKSGRAEPNGDYN